MRKNITALISFLILIIIMVIVVILFRPEITKKDESKIQIVATLFPQYDFAKQIVGDKAEVDLLVGAGVETHNYEPTAQDMILLLDNTDMFLYTGEFLEPWTTDIIETLEESNCKIVNVSENIELIKIEDFEKRYINSEIEDENHDHEEEHVHTESCDHQEMYDGHIWQNLDNAIIMLENTLNSALELSYLLQNVSRERIFTELKKAVLGENFEIFADLIVCGGLEFLNINKLPNFEKIKKMVNKLVRKIKCLYICNGFKNEKQKQNINGLKI